MSFSFSDLAAYTGIGPIIPVTLHFDEERSKWRKQPRVEWNRATTDLDVVDGWWRTWPDALPGIPLRLTDLCVVDADSAEGVAAVTGLGPLGPHSKVATPSGGLHLVFAQPPQPITKFEWMPGVEVLGTSCLLTCYDLEELLFPRVAPRAVLPEMFWKPREVGSRKREPINKDREEHTAAARADAVVVAGLTDGLFALDPIDWRGCHDEWLSLMNAAKWLGIAEDDFVQWSLGDPVYAADERVIRRKWRSLSPAHGGALYAALSAAGIKIAGAKRSLIDGHPLPASSDAQGRKRQPTRNWQSRVNTVCDALRRKQDPDCLFWAGCRIGEVMIDTKKPKPSIARALLEAACPRLRGEIGAEEIRRIITNAFDEVESEELKLQPKGTKANG